jgi:hypothetical protein
MNLNRKALQKLLDRNSNEWKPGLPPGPWANWQKYYELRWDGQLAYHRER